MGKRFTPAIPHPRWSQASEQLIGTSERVPTQRYRGVRGETVLLKSRR